MSPLVAYRCPECGHVLAVISLVSDSPPPSFCPSCGRGELKVEARGCGDGDQEHD